MNKIKHEHVLVVFAIVGVLLVAAIVHEKEMAFKSTINSIYSEQTEIVLNDVAIGQYNYVMVGYGFSTYTSFWYWENRSWNNGVPNNVVEPVETQTVWYNGTSFDLTYYQEVK